MCLLLAYATCRLRPGFHDLVSDMFLGGHDLTGPHITSCIRPFLRTQTYVVSCVKLCTRFFAPGSPDAQKTWLKLSMLLCFRAGAKLAI